MQYYNVYFSCTYLLNVQSLKFAAENNISVVEKTTRTAEEGNNDLYDTYDVENVDSEVRTS